MGARLAGLLGSPVVLIVAWTAVDAAVAVYLHVYGANVVSSVLLLAGIILFALAAQRRLAPAPTDRDAMLAILLVAHLVVAIVLPFRAEPPAPDPRLQLLPLAALVAVAVAWLVRSRRGSEVPWRAALGAVALLGLISRAAVVAADIAPPFDVARIQDVAGQALLEGTDPYLTEVFRGGYPYLPLAAIGAALGSLAGDSRWAVWVGDVLVVVGIVVFARRVGAATNVALLAAGLWAWWSGGLYVAWQGFPDPILIGLAVLGAAALAGPRTRSVAGGMLIGLAAATKQLGVGLIPFLVWPGHGQARAAVSAAIAAAVVVLPFAAWHPPEFVTGVVTAHVAEPGRAYALNLLNWPGGSIALPLVAGFAVAVAYGWLCIRRQTDPLATWLLGSSGVLLVAFALNRIAFVNYYAIPLALILLTIIRPPQSVAEA